MERLPQLHPILGGKPLTPVITLPSREDERPTPFIEANTVEGSLEDIRRNHLIPVFLRDNEPVISQVDFVEAALQAVHDAFPSERILSPNIRLSHPIRGRVPEAKEKPAAELLEWEKTLYYERMAFVIEVASIKDTIDGQPLCLTIGGVKAHNLDNLSQKRGAEQHFKVFIGFSVKVCSNLCVWTDGVQRSLKVGSKGELYRAIVNLVEGYDALEDLIRMSRMQDLSLTERQFAQLLGRCRMYQHLPQAFRKELPPMPLGDQAVGAVCRDYYRDEAFSRDASSSISLWRLYNLLTSANKGSYIDAFVDRAVDVSLFTASIADSLERGTDHWFLS